MIRTGSWRSRNSPRRPRPDRSTGQPNGCRPAAGSLGPEERIGRLFLGDRGQRPGSSGLLRTWRFSDLERSASLQRHRSPNRPSQGETGVRTGCSHARNRPAVASGIAGQSHQAARAKSTSAPSGRRAEHPPAAHHEERRRPRPAPVLAPSARRKLMMARLQWPGVCQHLEIFAGRRPRVSPSPTTLTSTSAHLRPTASAGPTTFAPVACFTFSAGHALDV